MNSQLRSKTRDPWIPEGKPAHLHVILKFEEHKTAAKSRATAQDPRRRIQNPQPICSTSTVSLQQQAHTGSGVPRLELVQIARNMNGE